MQPKRTSTQYTPVMWKFTHIINYRHSSVLVDNRWSVGICISERRMAPNVGGWFPFHIAPPPSLNTVTLHALNELIITPTSSLACLYPLHCYSCKLPSKSVKQTHAHAHCVCTRTLWLWRATLKRDAWPSCAHKAHLLDLFFLWNVTINKWNCPHYNRVLVLELITIRIMDGVWLKIQKILHSYTSSAK